MTRGASDQRPKCALAPHGRSRFLRALRPLRFEPLEDRRLLTTVMMELDESYTPTSLLVQFRPETEYAGSLGAHLAGSVTDESWRLLPGLREVTLAPGAQLDDALAAFSRDPHVLFAEPDYRVRLNMVPNDPGFASHQWHLRNTGQIEEPPGSDIRATAAWDITTGSPGVVVAVIDTGVDYLHPDLAANMWRNEDEVAGNGVDDDNNGYVDDVFGYDFANRDGDPKDDHLHGTHIAGTIAAVANNAVGVSGVAPGVKIMALKFLDASGNGLTSDAISALNYAVANGASISNNSFGGGPISQAFKAAIENALGANHIFVAAAGNYGTNIDNEPFYPASYEVENIITVGATDAADHLVWFSNYGKRSVDLGAPGTDIYSTFPTTMTEEMADRGITEPYGVLSGTSMAAPIVAGVIALVLSQNDGMSASEVITQVLATVDRSPALATKTVSGGRVNAAAALGGVPVDETYPRIVSSDPSGIVSGAVSQIVLTFSEPIDPSSFDLTDVLGMTGPLGPIAVQGVEPFFNDDRKFTLYFEEQTEPGSYSLLISSDIQDLAGNSLDQNEDNIGGDPGFDDYVAVFTLAAAEASIYHATDVPIEFDGFEPWISYLTIPDDMPIADLNARVDITFPRVGNLHVSLVSPAGTLINLSYRHGGDEENFTDTLFDDEAGIPIYDGLAPFTGSFQPDDPLETLDIENAQGTWQLVIQNVSETDNFGVLNAWSLEIIRRESGGGGGGDEEPVNDPPVAVDDHFNAFQGSEILIAPEELLENDSDPNNDILEVVAVRNPQFGTVQLTGEGTIVFLPAVGNPGLVSFEYVVSDGELSDIGAVLITLRSRFSLHNGYDVNADGFITAVDALLVINYINAYGPGPIVGLDISAVGLDISATATKLYYDVIADNYIAAVDSLAVINYINALGSGPVGQSLSMSGADEPLDPALLDSLLADDEKDRWLL